MFTQNLKYKFIPFIPHTFLKATSFFISLDLGNIWCSWPFPLPLPQIHLSFHISLFLWLLLIVDFYILQISRFQSSASSSFSQSPWLVLWSEPKVSRRSNEPGGRVLRRRWNTPSPSLPLVLLSDLNCPAHWEPLILSQFPLINSFSAVFTCAQLL